jgi:hypothetical protein
MAGVETTSAFAGEPQPVEVYHRGVWYTGELLAWRHDDDGRCLARVRCVVNGLRHSAWMDLADLRLPRPDAPASDGAAAAPVATTARPPVPQPVHGLPAPADPVVPAQIHEPPEADDETRPHLLLAVRPARPRPPGGVLPAPRYPRPSVRGSDGRLSAV